MIPTFRWSKIFMAGASALLLTGLCGCSDGEVKGKRGISSYGVRSNSNYSSTRGSVPDTGMKLYGAGTGKPVIHANQRLVYSQVLSDKVANVNGINTAFVVLTETNAYAAILIDHTATGTRGAGARHETNNSSTSLGRYYPHQFGSYQDPRLLTSGSNSYETVEEADNISHGLKQEIASIIRNAQPSVHEVYISAHRDFVNLMNGYAQDSARGLPLDSRVQEFNGMVNRVLSLPDRKTEDKIINGTVENKRNVR